MLNAGLAEPAGLSITSNPSQLLRFSQQEKPNPCAYKNSTSTWHRSFVSAAWDMWTRSMPTVRELCYDFCYDDQADRNFPRCWCLSGNQLEEFGPELQFQPDGTIKDHHDRESEWRWRWVESQALQQSQSYRSLEMIKTSWGHPAQIIEFHFHRSADAGFVLVGQDGTKLCSREKTIQEHIFRRYHGEPQYPRFVQQAVQAMADQADGPSVSFPAELTGFERLCAHRLADSFGLRHESSGSTRNRRLRIFGRNPTRFVQAAIDQHGITRPASFEEEAASSQQHAQQQHQMRQQRVMVAPTPLQVQSMPFQRPAYHQQSVTPMLPAVHQMPPIHQMPAVHQMPPIHQIRQMRAMPMSQQMPAARETPFMVCMVPVPYGPQQQPQMPPRDFLFSPGQGVSHWR